MVTEDVKVTEEVKAKKPNYWKSPETDCRELDLEDRLPPCDCTYLVVYKDGRSEMVSKASLTFFTHFIEYVAGEIKAGKAQLFITWMGQWKSDVFAVAAKDIDMYVAYVKDGASKKWVRANSSWKGAFKEYLNKHKIEEPDNWEYWF